ncbi:adhesion G protein-coupled receptor F5-like isoform X2 [Aquarana catesbeiana]
MTGLPSIMYLFLCLSWQATSVLSEKDFEGHLVPSMLRLYDNTHISFHREKRAASQDMASYEVEIEISFPDAALATNYTNVLKNMDVYASLPDTIVITSVEPSGACTFNGSNANCSCNQNYDCLGTSGPCVNGSCICITTFPHQQYCIPRSNITVSSDTIFQGDTITIYCTFSVSGNISWYLNSKTPISANQKYSTSSGLQGTMVQYTLKIGNVIDTDKGSYTCSLATGGTPQNLTTTISVIKTLQIQSSNDMDSYCDGASFTLTCCCPDIGKFNVTWTLSDPSGIVGTKTSDGSCSIYTLTPSITQSCSSVINYNCNFTRNEGATFSKIIKVTYMQKASISFTSSSSSNNTSAGKILHIVCNTNIPISSIAWAKGTLTNIVNSSNTLFTSSASTAWSDTYFCIVYQGSLSTSASVMVNIVPLPKKEAISAFPLMTVITSCGIQTKLSCCVTGPAFSSYRITFTNDNSPKFESNSNCYFTYITVGCTTGSTTTVSCVVYNRLGDSVPSDNMIVRYVEASSGDCKVDTSQGLPTSPSGSTYSVACLTITPSWLGTINYTCIDGIWFKAVNGCYSAAVYQQLDNVQNVIGSPEVQQTLPVLLKNITATATSEKQNIEDSSQTLQLMVDIISAVSNANVAVEPVMMQNFIKTVDVVVGTSSAWNGMASQSVTILNSVENFAKNLSFNGTINFTDDSLSNIQLSGQVVSKDDSYIKNFSMQHLTGSVFIDKGAIIGNSTTVVTIAYSTLKDILPNTTQGFVNGLVMSTIIKNYSENTDSSKFQINMNFSKSKTSLVNPECVWYDPKQKLWNNSSCTTITENDMILCSCNHLTSFSILMGSSIQDQFLAIITYIGVGISLGCLVITLLIEALVWASVIKNKTSYIRHVCLVNIAVTLLVADIWFIIGAALVENNKGSAACKAAAFFSFFFYLSLFFWMLTTGLILFYRMVYILHDMSRKTMMIIAFLLGYGSPLLITIITVASTEPSKRFISSKFCWLDYSDSRSFLAFVVPALTIVFVDILILVVVIFKLMRPTIGEQSGKEDRKILILIAKTMAILTPLLGTTWGFGLGVVIHPDNLVINVIFAVLNSFQGLFILISTVLLDQKVRKAVSSSITSSYFRTLRSRGQTTSTDSSGTSKPKRRKKPYKKIFFGKRAVYHLYSTQDSSETSGNSYSVLT